jgi:HK97 family phage major capsid protein
VAVARLLFTGAWMLTKEEKQNIAQGFEAAGERMKVFEDELAEVREFANELTKRMKQMRASWAEGAFRKAENYRRFWPSDEEAKEFGELVLKALGRKAMGEGGSTEGGVLVPTTLREYIIDKLGRYGKFRRDAMVVPLESDRELVPKVESGMTVYCPGEGNATTESDMSFSQVGLTPKKWCALAKISSELEEDAVIALGEILGTSFARSMAKKEDEVGFVGDGTETYFGMTGICQALKNINPSDPSNIPGLVVASGNAYSEITLADFREVVGILPEDVDETAKWYMSKKFYYNVVYPLAETAGVANIFEILSDRKSKYFLGYEVVFVHAMPSTEANSQVCAILGDLQVGAYLGERKRMTIDRSVDRYFENDQIGVRAVERIDINAYGVGDLSEVGPIVGLITAPS